MIIPTKHLSLGHSLIGVGASLLNLLEKPLTATSLWESARILPEVRTYDRFILAIDLLYLLGLITFDEGFLRRANP